MPIYKTTKVKDGKSQYKVVVCYTDPQGNYKQKSRTAYGAAEAKFEEMKLQAELQDKAPAMSHTLMKLYQEYIITKKSEVRVSTLQKSMSILENDVLPYLGNIKLENLTVSRLQQWKNLIAARSTKVITKNNAYREFNTLLNYAVRMEYIGRNPLNNLGNFRETDFTGASDKLHYYTAEQFATYISTARNLCKSNFDFGFYVFFCIAYFTGMRKGEINALKWSDIDGNILHVRRSIAQKNKGGDIETPPKNRSSYRDIQIPQPLMEILSEHKERQKAQPNFSDNFRVCGAERVLRDTSIENHNIKYAEAAGLPHIRIHDFRHSHASLLCNEGINIQEVARRLGHANISMTWNTYSHLYPREEERAVQILNNIDI